MIDQLLLHVSSHYEVDKTFDQQRLHQFMPPLDPYLSDLAEFGADSVDEAMLPVDRFSMQWDPPLVPPSETYVSRQHILPLCFLLFCSEEYSR